MMKTMISLISFVYFTSSVYAANLPFMEKVYNCRPKEGNEILITLQKEKKHVLMSVDLSDEAVSLYIDDGKEETVKKIAYACQQSEETEEAKKEKIKIFKCRITSSGELSALLPPEISFRLQLISKRGEYTLLNGQSYITTYHFESFGEIGQKIGKWSCIN